MQAAFEAYLSAVMVKLCRTSEPISESDLDSFRRIEAFGLFDVHTPFERIANMLGPGATAAPHLMESIPESLKGSVEHRYLLTSWPLFEFRILESRDGLAWGQTFVRRTDILPPPISSIADLRAWSHIESEVCAAIGEPESSEEWSPWKTAIYVFDATEYAICYVYDLLQRIEVLNRLSDKR